MENPFMKEAWLNKSRKEHGKEKMADMPLGYENDVQSLEKIEKAIKDVTDIPEDSKGILTDMYESVIDSVKEYNESILDFNEGKMKEIDREDMNRLDHVRRFSHNALITNLDVLARFMGEHALDKSWRNDVGLDRKQVQRWAQNVLLHLQQTDQM